MRKVFTVLMAVVAVVAIVAPVHAQAPPAAKVTIQGLIDNLAVYNSNKSANDATFARRDKETYFRTRVRPDIIGEVGSSKFVLGLEMDYSYGQISSNRDQAADKFTFRGSERFGLSSGSTLNTDIVTPIEIKWAYTEFNIPLPIATRLRIGAQPDDATYKLGTYFTGDFSGFNLDMTASPAAKLHVSYVPITDRGTGRGDGFLRGADYAVVANVEITPVKGIDIRPLYSYVFLSGATSNSFSGPRLARGGVGNGRCAGQVTSLAVAGAQPAPGNLAAATGPAVAPCFPDGGHEDRNTVGVDMRLRSGPFFIDPTVFYQFGYRRLRSNVGRFAGVDHTQRQNAWLTDIRGGWQSGPLLLELAAIYTTGNKATQDIRDANRRVQFFQPLSTDASYYGAWSNIVASDLDFIPIRANFAGVSPGTSIGYDKYGIIRLGTRTTYALTPAFSLRLLASGNWTAEKVDTRGALTIGTGIIPSLNHRPATGQRYLGTDLEGGFTYKIAPNVALDFIGGVLITGPGLATATAAPLAGGDGTAITRSGAKVHNVETVTTRFRYTF